MIELPKLPAEIQENSSDLLLWAKFFASEKKEDFEVLAEMNPEISSAYQRLQVISQDDKKRREYDARMKALRDYNQGMIEAMEKGIEKGIEKGRMEERKNLIEAMSASMSLEQISQVIKMPVSDIEKIISD